MEGQWKDRKRFEIVASFHDTKTGNLYTRSRNMRNRKSNFRQNDKIKEHN